MLVTQTLRKSLQYHPLPTYGDGTAIPTNYLELLLKIAEESQVLLKWEAGDLVLLDVSSLLDPSFLRLGVLRAYRN